MARPKPSDETTEKTETPAEALVPFSKFVNGRDVTIHARTEEEAEQIAQNLRSSTR